MFPKEMTTLRAQPPKHQKLQSDQLTLSILKQELEIQHRVEGDERIYVCKHSTWGTKCQIIVPLDIVKCRDCTLLKMGKDS